MHQAKFSTSPVQSLRRDCFFDDSSEIQAAHAPEEKGRRKGEGGRGKAREVVVETGEDFALRLEKNIYVKKKSRDKQRQSHTILGNFSDINEYIKCFHTCPKCKCRDIFIALFCQNLTNLVTDIL